MDYKQLPPAELKGITWNHSRGMLPVVATALRFNELCPQVRITWQVRSLQNFADQSVEQLAQQFDLLVIDHPSIGEAAQAQAFVALDAHLSSDYLANQARNTVGASHRSYQWRGRQYALALDAATPVSVSRPDLLQKLGLARPETWEELMTLARTGRVAFAGLGLDCLMYWYALCQNEGEEPFTREQIIVSREVGCAALEAVRELALSCGRQWLGKNPIQVLSAMSSGTQYVYCPMAYGYSNYSRRHYAEALLQAGALVSHKGKRLNSTLGGAGLAVSAHASQLRSAIAYAEFSCSEAIQTGIYTAAGGQPAHRAAWLDEENNRISDRFFAATLPTLDSSYVRPRYPGYIDFQGLASQVMTRYLEELIGTTEAFEQLNLLDISHRGGWVNDMTAQQAECSQ